jgi:fatty-acyl-CoA synthase
MPAISTLAEILRIEKNIDILADAPVSTYDMIVAGAKGRADQLALRYIPDPNQIGISQDWTFAELLHRIRQAGNMFRDLADGERAVVSIILPNCPAYHVALWGAQIAAIVNPVNPLLEPAHMAEIMRAAGTKILVTCPAGDAQGIGARALAAAQDLPTLKHVLLVHADDNGHTVAGPENTVGWNQALSWYSGVDGISSDPQTLHLPAAYFHTGGTTGMPKLAVLTHANMIASVTAARHHLPMPDSGAALCGLPLFHINGVIATGLLPWSLGHSVILAGPRGYRDPALLSQFWRAVAYYRVSYFSGVPTIYQTLADVPPGESDLSSLRYAICGAAPLPLEVRRRFEANIGIPILEGYGLTESACISTISPLGPDVPRPTIGLRLVGQEMKAAMLGEDGAYQRDCAVNEPGVILIRGPNVFKGYHDESHDRTAWIADPDGGERWFNTGDLGYCDAAGFWRLTGRRKELIIRGGHNIDPLIIESALLQHPAVAAAAAIGRPDARVGEVPVAYVQLRPGQAVTEAELLKTATQAIPERAAHPRRIKIVDAIPLTAVGKPFKPALVWREIADVVAAEAHAVPGLTLEAVTVDNDRNRGNVARITATADAGADTLQALESRLRNYSFGYDLIVAE